MSEGTIQAILATCRDRGIVLNAAGEKLSINAPKQALTPDLLDGLRQHKASLIETLRRHDSKAKAAQRQGDPQPEAIPVIAADADVTPWEECIEPPDPCPKCGSLMFWWDVLGGQHCMICEKPKYSAEKAAKLREMAKRLRQFPRRASSLRQGR